MVELLKCVYAVNRICAMDVKFYMTYCKFISVVSFTMQFLETFVYIFAKRKSKVYKDGSWGESNELEIR